MVMDDDETPVPDELMWENRITQTDRVAPFFLLQLNPPPAPIFKDAKQSNIIPQVLKR